MLHINENNFSPSFSIIYSNFTVSNALHYSGYIIRPSTTLLVCQALLVPPRDQLVRLRTQPHLVNADAPVQDSCLANASVVMVKVSICRSALGGHAWQDVLQMVIMTDTLVGIAIALVITISLVLSAGGEGWSSPNVNTALKTIIIVIFRL